MRAFSLLSFLLCGAVASATDYSYWVNLSDNGGAYAVGAGENKVVAQDCSYDNLYAAGENVGGAIYVGENANLKLQGNHITLIVQPENGVTSSVTMTGYTMEAGGVKIEMCGESDATVPEPTTARRRRSA